MIAGSSFIAGATLPHGSPDDPESNGNEDDQTQYRDSHTVNADDYEEKRYGRVRLQRPR
jgi:hypothetical protein